MDTYQTRAWRSGQLRICLSNKKHKTVHTYRYYIYFCMVSIIMLGMRDCVGMELSLFNQKLQFLQDQQLKPLFNAIDRCTIDSYDENSLRSLIAKHRGLVNRQDRFGITCLHYALAQEQEITPEQPTGMPATEFLLKNYPQLIHIADKWENMPLHYAVQYNHENAVREILTHHNVINMNHMNLAGRTALSMACQYASNEIIRHILSIKSVDPNAQDIYNNTPLHYAVCRTETVPMYKKNIVAPKPNITYNPVKAVRFLTCRGADIDIVNHQGFSAYTAAQTIQSQLPHEENIRKVCAYFTEIKERKRKHIEAAKHQAKN